MTSVSTLRPCKRDQYLSSLFQFKCQFDDNKNVLDSILYGWVVTGRGPSEEDAAFIYMKQIKSVLSIAYN